MKNPSETLAEFLNESALPDLLRARLAEQDDISDIVATSVLSYGLANPETGETIDAASIMAGGSSSPSESGFDIKDMASWVGLFEASRITNLTDGASLSTWSDASGNSNDAAQSGSARPIYKGATNGINGQPVVRFASASSQYMQTAAGGASLGSNFYMAALVRWTTNSGFQAPLCFGEEANGKRRCLLKYDAGNSNRIGWNGQNADITPGGLAPSAGSVHFYEIVRNGSAISVYCDGAITSSGSPSLNAFTGTKLTLGALNDGTSSLNGDIALALFLGSAPDSMLLAKIRGYVSAVYGVSFPIGGGNYAETVSPASLSTLSSFFDNGAQSGVIDRQFAAFCKGRGAGHILAVDDAAIGVASLQNFDSAGYSAFDFWDATVGRYNGGTLILPFGAAAGWGNANEPASIFRGVGYFECYDLQSSGSAYRGFRLVQTKNGSPQCRRIEVDGATGDITFYRRDSAYPSETAILVIKESGAIMMPTLPTSDPFAAGQVWCDAGDGNRLKLSAGS